MTTSSSAERRPRGRRSDPAAGERPGRSERPEPSADPEAQAREICLRLLTLRPHTRAELATALHRRELPDEVIDGMLGRFAAVGLVDDRAFAEAWVSSRHAGRGLARRALAQELRQRGVDRDTVTDAVERLDEDTELETARRLVARRLSATTALPPDRRAKRLAGVLARKGYPPSVTWQVVREALAGEADELVDGWEQDSEGWDGHAADADG